MRKSIQGEQFFTCDFLVQSCVDLTKKRYSLDDFKMIVEPSAGDGAFVAHLPPEKLVCLDIEPLHPLVRQQDFLTWKPEVRGRILTIGNPPFGRRAALAVRFVERACSFSDVVAFILPRSFNKYTFHSRVPQSFHLMESMNCDAFRLPDGSAHSVKAVFQIWEKRPTSRLDVCFPSQHEDFSMKHCHTSRVSEEDFKGIVSSYPYSIPQVGSKFRLVPSHEVKAGSHWFIRPAAGKTNLVVETFANASFSFLDDQNTTFKSLSKRDIVRAYTNALP